uniref:Amine oxidase n=1 Tax=Suricata suricatta TaxID=37032 RepID=A0A673V4P7_SURSU
MGQRKRTYGKRIIQRLGTARPLSSLPLCVPSPVSLRAVGQVDDLVGLIQISCRYQLAVTRRKGEEPSSTSIYNLNDPWTPTVDFSDFINNETIAGQDLVAWVTAGFLHIPHAEDVPNTVTVGNGLCWPQTCCVPGPDRMASEAWTDGHSFPRRFIFLLTVFQSFCLVLFFK